MNALELAGLAGLIFAFAEPSLPPPPPTPLPTAEQKQSISASETANANPTEQPTRPEIDCYRATDKHSNNSDKPSKDWIMEILTGVLAVIAIVQITFMRQGMRQDRINQRAWVATAGIQAKLPVAGEKFIVRVMVKNTGKTFARRVTISCYSRAAPVEMGLLDFAQIIKDMEQRPVSRSVSLLAPDGVYAGGSVSETGIKKEVADEFAEGETRIFIFGKIAYTDVFDCEHWTTYCSILNPDGTLEVCEKFNDADNNLA